MDCTKHVVTVGEGRGFVVEGPRQHLPEHLHLPRDLVVVKDPRQRFIITAAHCLPDLPPATRGSYWHERTYRIVGPLGGKDASIFTECLFVDPISDLAILGEPDTQALASVVDEQEADGYYEFIESIPPMPIGELCEEEEIFVLQLDGRWTSGKGSATKGTHWSTLWLTEVTEGIHDGMSGSPIVNQRAEAVGVVSISSGAPGVIHTKGDCASLVRSLPAWFR